MRQGEIRAPGGKWTGPSGAGVSAPDPVIIPTPKARFATTAARLERLAEGHAAEVWLRFMAQIATGQHQAAGAAREGAPSTALPPDGLTVALHPSWQQHLFAILDHVGGSAVPAEARLVMETLKGESPDALDSLAHTFLHGEIPKAQIGQAFYVAAALQVQFTTTASQRDAASAARSSSRGLCPCCGSTPVVGVVRASGRAPGCRYLHCSLCSTAWNHVRAVCIHCGEAGKLTLQSIEGGGDLVKAETCGHCGTYSKLLDERKDPHLDPVADDLATLGLDLLVASSGWSRHAPNPLLLIL
jgi:FdhE protein